MGSERISPTAHFTGYTWYRNGLSHRALATRAGRLMVQTQRPLAALSRRAGLPTLEGLLLARHDCIDQQLASAIESGAIGQVVEIAAGLSPRGWDFSRRFGDRLAYIEADLPDMAAHKRRLLERAGLQSAGHRVVVLDALADSGAHSLAALVATLDPDQGVAIVTEGLINYFPTDAVLGMWRRFAQALGRFPHGLYLSDLHIAGENRGPGIAMAVRLLSTFVRGQVHLHFDSAGDAVQALRDAGFKRAEAETPKPRRSVDGSIDPAGARLVRVLRAET